MADEVKDPLGEHGEELEEMAIAVWAEILSNSLIDPKVRRDVAADVMRARGKDAPLKYSGPGTVVFIFGNGIKTAVAGIGTVQDLLDRKAPDPETTFTDDESTS